MLSCEKEEVDSNEIPSNVVAYFRGEVDGDPVKIDVTTTNINDTFLGSGGSFDYPTCYLDYGCSVGSILETPPIFGFNLNNFFEGPCDDEVELFPTLFQLGDVAFDDDDYQNTEKSVSLYYQTENGNEYSSIGDQSGSTFAITNVSELSSPYGIYQSIEASFTVKLYNDEDVTDIIEISNGTFNLPLSPYHD